MRRKYASALRAFASMTRFRPQSGKAKIFLLAEGLLRTSVSGDGITLATAGGWSSCYASAGNVEYLNVHRTGSKGSQQGNL